MNSRGCKKFGFVIPGDPMWLLPQRQKLQISRIGSGCDAKNSHQLEKDELIWYLWIS